MEKLDLVELERAANGELARAPDMIGDAEHRSRPQITQAISQIQKGGNLCKSAKSVDKLCRSV
jgi:hypothetical protein